MKTKDEIDIDAVLAERRQIAIIWSIEDVQAVRPDLNDEQAWQVLKNVQPHYDAEFGINWTALEATAETLFGAGPEASES